MKLPATLQPGRAQPFGALARDGGVNFAVFSDHATRIELCLFDSSGARELKRHALHGPSGEDPGVFQGFLEQVGPGLDDVDLDAFEALLAQDDDHQLYAWIIGTEPTPDLHETPLMARLRDFMRDHVAHAVAQGAG